jgi:hypothetical protein
MVEKSDPGFYSAVHLQSVSELSSYMHAGEVVTARRLATIASITGGLVQRVGELACVAGESGERCRANALLELVTSASSDMQIQQLPAEFPLQCARVRVPAAAGAAILDAIEAIEDDTGTLCVWLPPAEAPRTAFTEEEACFKVGLPVRAQFEGEWHDATVADVDIFERKLVVMWQWDQSKTQLSMEKVKPKLTKWQKLERRRCKWLRAPWVLVIFGSKVQRLIAALRIMAKSEEVCQGLWSSEMIDCLDELRNASDVGGCGFWALCKIHPNQGVRILSSWCAR